MTTSTIGFDRDERRRVAASAASSAKRREKARIKRRIHAREVTLADVLGDPPACLGSMPLFEVAALEPRFGRKKVIALGERAIRDGVNLATPLEWASRQQRDWLAVHVQTTPWVRAAGRLPGA